MDSMYRLNDGHFLNDVIVNTMAHRLASEDVGVIDSLTIASKLRTSNFRAKIQTTMSRGRVLIFLNHNFHWMLYVWTPTEQLLQEYNSMPEPGGRFSGCCDTVTAFVKWAHGKPDMAINLERPACAEQQNGWDCRVFTIGFAECLARGQAIPHAIDGSLERKCLTNAILVTWAGALHPEEISNIGCSLAESPADKRRQFLNYFQRKRSFRQLLSVGGSEYATSHAFTTNLRQIAESEDDAIQKSVLASMIDSIHVVHRKSLELALSAATQATTLLEKSRQWTDVKNKMDDLLSTLAEMGPPGDLAALPAPDQSRHRNIEIIRNAGQNMQNDWDLCQGNDQSVREAREEAEACFSMTRVQLLILYHAVRKFRQDDANSSTA
ncbi:hypothetical protein CFRS1_v015713 [Colletotrichum fructicola]|nr:hypothetical protein CFRS1_v015713 [Colletotrichum fructicola]